VGPRDVLDARKISSPPGCDPGLSSPWSFDIPTELLGPQDFTVGTEKNYGNPYGIADNLVESVSTYVQNTLHASVCCLQFVGLVWFCMHNKCFDVFQFTALL